MPRPKGVIRDVVMKSHVLRVLLALAAGILLCRSMR